MRVIFNFGSLNVDHVYRLPHFPGTGETLAALDYQRGLGGKGANQSVAVARAGGKVSHIGAIGPDADWLLDQLARDGVDITHIARLDTPTGHAIIQVDTTGENAILIYPGANRALGFDHMATALADAVPGDWLMLQNETAHTSRTARLARGKAMKVAYSAAPFDADETSALLPHLTLLIVNEVEAAQLSDKLDLALDHLPVPQILITRGADGAEWIDHDRGETGSIPAFPVTPVDTTGAGDTFAGYTIAGLAQGFAAEPALRRAAAAAALQIQKHGTADAIPNAAEVDAFLAQF